MSQRPRGIWGPACRCLAGLAAALLVSCGGGGGGATPGNPGPAPSITAFTAAKPVITAGTGTVLTAFFTDASSASVDQGVGPVTSGAGFSVAPRATTTYTLSASGAGAPARRSVTVTVVPPASILSFSAIPAAVASGTTSQLTPVFSGGTGSIEPGIGAVTSGVPAATGAVLSATTYILTVTNPAGDFVTWPVQVAPTFQVTFIPGPGGSLLGSLNQAQLLGGACSAVTAAPAPGCSFTGWTGAGFAPSVQNPLVVSNVSQNLAITANFAINTYTLTYTAGPNGSVSLPSPQTVSYGASGAAVTALPATGYHFVQWSDGSAANPRTDAAVSGNLGVTASFAINTYNLTYTAGPNGSVSGTSPQTVSYGSSSAAVTAQPAIGYHFVQWSDGSAINPRSDTAVSGNLGVSASFAIDTYSLTYTAGPNGSLSGPSPQTVSYGASGAAVTALPATGYHFVQWSDGSAANPRSDTAITGNAGVTASFAINTYTLTFAAGSGGALGGATAQNVAYGGSASQVSAIPSAGYTFLDWTGTGGFAATSANPLTVSAVTADVAVTANFTSLYVVHFAPGPNGSLTGPANQAIVAGGSAAQVTAVPDAGYGFLSWTGTGGFTTTSANPLNLAGVNANMTVTANFAHLPVISNFRAASTTIGKGQAANLSWDSMAATATSASIDNGGGPVSTGNSSIQLYPPATITYTLTAVNAAGSSSRSLTITVVPAPVINSFTAAPTNLAAGQSTTLAWTTTGATTLTLDNGIGGVAGNSLDVTPPTGTTQYRLTASSIYGSASAQVSVTSGPPAALTYSANPALYSRNVAITANNPSNTGGPINSYIVVPALPFGLSLNPATGAITGTPSSLQVRSTYTVRGSNSYGNTQVSLDLTVNELPPVVAYTGGPFAFGVGVPVVLSATCTGGPVATWAIAPALPAGLTFNTANGQISGTPTTVAGTQVYTVTASNTGGTVAPGLSINVYQAAPSFSYSSGSYTFWLGAAIPPLVPALSGGPVATWSISPALPAGLLFDPATGQISGTPSVTASAQTYTISAGNQGGTASATPSIAVAVQPPVISVQPFGQILAPGPAPSFSVTASGYGALAYQWYRNGSAVGGATSSSYTAPNFQAADDGTAYTVVVSDAYGGITPSAPAVVSLLHDLASWLTAHPAIAAAIKWQFKAAHPSNYYLPPDDTDKLAWPGWSTTQQAELNQAYLDAAAWYSQGMAPVTMLPGGPGLTDQPQNLSIYINNDNSSTFERVSPAYMWQLYLGHVAFTLMLETSQQLPWSVTDYPDTSLRWLFDSATMAWFVPDNTFWMGTYESAWLPLLRADNRPRTSFADPRWTYRWLRQAGIIGASRLATIGGTLDWMRQNLTHFYGLDVFGNDFAIWQYRGWSPISQIVAGTIDSNDPADGVQHWTAGCHGSTGFVNAALRVVNIPVEPVWVNGHELIHFLSEGQYLDHADDPYNSNVTHSSLPSLNLLIDAATWKARFGPDETVNIKDNNPITTNWVGYSATQFH